MSTSEQPSVAVLLPTLNRPDNVKNFLDSLLIQTQKPTKVVLVDQSDNDQTKKFFENYDLGKIEKVYFHQKEKSLTKARNNALRLSGDVDFVAFFDDDIILYEKYFEILLDVFKKDTQHQYAAGMGVFDPIPPSTPLLFKIFRHSHIGDGKFMVSKVATWPWHLKNFSEVEFVSGGLTFYRADIIKKHGFDGNLLGYGHGDDVDVSYRLSRKHKMFFEPKAQCIHNHAPAGRDNKYKHRMQWLQNMYYLHQKKRRFYFKDTLGLILRHF
jgi:glycosyltransferase involved in cell wall biosynthesis